VTGAMLSRFGAEVELSASAMEARRKLERRAPDVLIVDIAMPIEDGHSLLAGVRGLSAEKGGQIPAIALTSYASPRDRARTLESGFQVHMSKPVLPSELVKVILRLLERLPVRPGA
jgi:CheY-like chemotaxis protein